MSTLVELKEEENYCLITMDDGKANALSFDMLAQLNGALDQAAQAKKVVIICGRPGKFSAGFDLSIMGQGGDAMIDLLQQGAGLSRRLLEFDTPVILAVSGHALAMGGLLLLSADYRIGINGGFKIGLNEVAIGMTLPYFGVELARARLASDHVDRAVNLAELYDAPAAVAAGFLDESVEAEELVKRATELADQLAGINMEAHRNTKARVREPLYAALESALTREFAGL